MGSKNHAGIHTGRNDSNRRPRGSRRRTALDPFVWSPSDAEQAAEEAAYRRALDRHFLARATAEAEAGDESLDGVHPVET